MAFMGIMAAAGEATAGAETAAAAEGVAAEGAAAGRSKEFSMGTQSGGGKSDKSKKEPEPSLGDLLKDA
jgi:hypothetical protein